VAHAHRQFALSGAKCTLGPQLITDRTEPFEKGPHQFDIIEIRRQYHQPLKFKTPTRLQNSHEFWQIGLRYASLGIFAREVDLDEHRQLGTPFLDTYTFQTLCDIDGV
jgi:hypothetical protein